MTSLLLLLALAAQESPVLVVDRDDVRITESCRVQVKGDRIADAQGDGVIHIVADGVTVDFQGETLRGAALDAPPDTFSGVGVRITGKNVTLRGLIVQGFKTGIWATSADGLTIDACDVSHNYRQRLKSTPEAEDLSDWLWPHNNDANEWLTNYGAGIYVEQSRGVTVKGCTAHHGQNGLCLREVHESRVFDNDFSFLSGWGVAMYRSTRNILARNNCDFCVRGYSHGVYSRGQDSAGFLVFEQCTDNLFAYNSATHSGDGFFGYAGNEALDRAETPRTGCNRNVLYRNDFSYAPAIGIEMTFSFDNQFVENRLMGGNYGIWGGYSKDTLADGNAIEANLIAGIAVEHGSGWRILRNQFHGNARAMQLWWDEDKDLLAKPWAKLNGAESKDHLIGANRIASEGQQVGIELSGGTTGVRVLANEWTGGERRIVCDETSKFTEQDAPVPLAPFHDERLANLPGERKARGHRKHLEGRDKILMTEWGPYDWQSPYLHEVRSSGAGAAYRLLGPAPIHSARADGEVDLRVNRDTSPPTIDVVARRADAVVPYTLVVDTGEGEFSAWGVVVGAKWTVRAFAWTIDPREDYDAWRKAAREGVSFTADALLLAYGGDGPSQLAASNDALRSADLPKDRFGTLAEAAVEFPPGRWRLTSTSDDGIRVYLDDELLIDDWTWHAPKTHTADVEFSKATVAKLRVEHFELDGYATLSLRIERAPE